MNATRYIAKCKTCSVVTSGVAAGSQPATQTAEMAARGESPDGVPYYHYRTGAIVLNCRQCALPRYAKMVRGKFSAKHECSAKCMSSTGTICECSCAGKNHGGSYASA